MKKIIEILKEKKLVHYIIITIVGLLVSIPLFKVQLLLTDDGVPHLIRIIGLDVAIKDGKFPFLITPYICNNFSYSLTAFYPPLVGYGPYIISILVNSFHAGLKIFACLTVILSGISMYNFTYEVTKNKGISFLSGIIYITFPYRFEVIYNRFAIGEFTALIFLPILFEGLYNLINGDQKKHYYIAIGTIFIILSHTITTIYAALFCSIYILFNIKKFFRKSVIKKCIINIIFILLISALFLVPLLEFKSQTEYTIFNPYLMRSDGVFTQKTSIEIWQFLKGTGEFNEVSFVVGIPTLIMLCITLLSYEHINEKDKSLYSLFFLLGIISIFMCTKYFPWFFMPQILTNIQYPWRLVGFANFFFAPVFAINIYILLKMIKREKIKTLAYILVFLVLGIFTIIKLNSYGEFMGENKDKDYEQILVNKKLKISHKNVHRDYLPIKAILEQDGYLVTREDKVYIILGSANISNESKEALSLRFEINNGKKDTFLEIPYLFYPGYVITLESGDEKIKLDYTESMYGFIQIKLPKDIEKGKVNVEYTGTTLEKASYIISGISLIIFIVYIIYCKRTNKEKEYEK